MTVIRLQLIRLQISYDGVSGCTEKLWLSRDGETVGYSYNVSGDLYFL